jgi:hypothetical protein
VLHRQWQHLGKRLSFCLVAVLGTAEQSGESAATSCHDLRGPALNQSHCPNWTGDSSPHWNKSKNRENGTICRPPDREVEHSTRHTGERHCREDRCSGKRCIGWRSSVLVLWQPRTTGNLLHGLPSPSGVTVSPGIHWNEAAAWWCHGSKRNDCRQSGAGVGCAMPGKRIEFPAKTGGPVWHQRTGGAEILLTMLNMA